jgi:hypothetical protein
VPLYVENIAKCQHVATINIAPSDNIVSLIALKEFCQKSNFQCETYVHCIKIEEDISTQVSFGIRVTQE